MMELAPQTKSIWIPYQKSYPIVKSQLDAINPAAESLGVKILEFPANNAAEVKAELDRRSELDDIGFEQPTRIQSETISFWYSNEKMI